MRYYVNKRAQDSGDHEVHTEKCQYLPSDGRYLGEFAGCAPAVREARKHYVQVNGCRTCSHTCHTQ